MATHERLELLRSVPLFSGLRRRELERVLGLASEIDVPDGHVLTRQGESGHEFFVVLSGNVIVERDGEDRARRVPGRDRAD